MKKKITIILLIWSIINLMCLGIGYLLSDSHSFNESLSPSTTNINVSTMILFIVQTLNIFLLILVLRKNKYIKLIFTFVILTSIIAIVIPVKIETGIRYNFRDKVNTNTGSLPYILSDGSTTTITEYKNLYSITLKEVEHTSGGIDIF